MSEKIITDKLIISELEKQGYFDFCDMEQTKAWSMLQAHYNCEVDDQWNKKHYDFYCYAESTADGYEVFIATHNPDSICISDEVHYYDSDLSDEIVQAIQDGNSMFIDDLDSAYFMYAVEECYDKMIEKLQNVIEEQLINKGYAREADTTTEATA